MCVTEHFPFLYIVQLNFYYMLILSFSANGSAAGNHDGNKMTFILQALIATLAAMLLRY